MQAPARRTAVPAQQPGSVGTPSRHEQLLASLSAAAAAPQVVADRRYAPLRQLLAAAPAGGEARAAFARNLVRVWQRRRPCLLLSQRACCAC